MLKSQLQSTKNILRTKAGSSLRHIRLLHDSCLLLRYWHDIDLLLIRVAGLLEVTRHAFSKAWTLRMVRRWYSVSGRCSRNRPLNNGIGGGSAWGRGLLLWPWKLRRIRARFFVSKEAEEHNSNNRKDDTAPSAQSNIQGIIGGGGGGGGGILP